MGITAAAGQPGLSGEALHGRLDGLDAGEAARRLARDGPNELPEPPRRNVLRVIAGMLGEPMFLLLLIAAVIYLVIGDLLQGLLLSGFAAPSIGLVVVQQARSERVAADAVLRRADALRVDESLLTGESLPVGKEAAPTSPAHAAADDCDGPDLAQAHAAGVESNAAPGNGVAR